ncbi:MAG: type II secretion system protein N [Pseudomonadota bacterium]
MKRGLAYFGLGLVMYAVFLAATLPAPWAYHWAQTRLGGVALSGLSGTLWNGRALTAQLGPTRLEKFHWSLNPWVLLRGRLGADLEFDYRGEPAALAVSRGFGERWHFSDVALRLPARTLESWLRLPSAELGGALDLRFDKLVIDQSRITAAQGLMTWDKAAVVRPVAADLGGFTVTLDNEDEGIKGVLKDQGGAVQADGVLSLKPDGNYDFTGSLVSGDPRQPAIAQGLQLFGQPGGDGRVKLSIQGTLPLLLPGAG